MAKGRPKEASEAFQRKAWRNARGPGRALQKPAKRKQWEKKAMGRAAVNPKHAQPGAADLIAPRIPPGRVDGLWLGLQFDCLNVDLDGCRDAV